MDNIFYDGTKLLSLVDSNGNKPEIYLCTSNRSAGKTTYFGRYLVNRFLKQKEKFCLLYRFNYELDDVAGKFFKDIGTLFFPDYEMESKRMGNGIYHELFLNGESCGYALTLNSADQIKKMSHLFSDTKRILMDEFQSETNHYCANEITKFISIHTSLARGGGEQVRYLPVIMLSNPVTLLNPYYTAMGISERLQQNTRFLRGDGFVLEQGFVESASKAQKESAFNQALKKEKYLAYSAENVYLVDNTAFIGKPDGKSTYIVTIKCAGEYYAVREYAELGLIYADDHADLTYPFKITTTTEDHQINYVMLRKHDQFIGSMRYFFEKGCFRFKNLKCKEAIMKTLSY